MAVIYLDHAATTAMRPEVVEAMMPYFSKEFYNPSGIYQSGQNVRKKIEEARSLIANCIGAQADEIFFTSGGTEADNWAIQALARQTKSGNGQIVTSEIEHHAVGNSCMHVNSDQCRVKRLSVDERGRIRLKDLENAIDKDTIGISIMYANNEIGTIQPISEIGRLARQNSILFHTDAVQACGQIPINVRKSQIDLLSASAHKFQGPKGVGFLYVRRGIPLHRMIAGGGQERGMRAGTENVPGIVGMAKALELAVRDMEVRMRKETYLRDYMFTRIQREIPFVRVNGHRWYRLPNNVNLAFRFINSESLLVLLDMEGICASGGSACNSGSAKPSHVIQAIRVPDEYKNGVIRFTLGAENTLEEIDRVVNILKVKVDELRKESPEYEDYLK